MCVKYNAPIYLENHPDFSGFPDYYTFALTVLEKRPVFVGDKLYSLKGKDSFLITENDGIAWIESLSWTPPTKKRTFMLELSAEELGSLYALFAMHCKTWGALEEMKSMRIKMDSIKNLQDKE